LDEEEVVATTKDLGEAMEKLQFPWQCHNNWEHNEMLTLISYKPTKQVFHKVFIDPKVTHDTLCATLGYNSQI
jgi:hypothetical protein